MEEGAKRSLPNWMALQEKEDPKSQKAKEEKSSGSENRGKKPTPKKKKGSNRRKAPSSFLLFLSEYRQQSEGKGYRASEISKEAGSIWRSMDNEDKQPYIKKSKELRDAQLRDKSVEFSQAKQPSAHSPHKETQNKETQNKETQNKETQNKEIKELTPKKEINETIGSQAERLPCRKGKKEFDHVDLAGRRIICNQKEKSEYIFDDALSQSQRFVNETL